MITTTDIFDFIRFVVSSSLEGLECERKYKYLCTKRNLTTIEQNRLVSRRAVALRLNHRCQIFEAAGVRHVSGRGGRV